MDDVGNAGELVPALTRTNYEEIGTQIATWGRYNLLNPEQFLLLINQRFVQY